MRAEMADAHSRSVSPILMIKASFTQLPPSITKIDPNASVLVFIRKKYTNRLSSPHLQAKKTITRPSLII
jgi:hypothetical protein